MSSMRQKTNTLQGSKDENTSADCEFIVLDSTGDIDDTEDDIIFEKEVPLVSPLNLPPALANEPADDVEVICISSQESSCGVPQLEGNEDQDNEKDLNNVGSNYVNNHSCEADNEKVADSKETSANTSFCIDYQLPKSNIVNEEPSTNKKLDEDPQNTMPTAADEVDEGEIELVMESDLFCVDTKPESKNEKKLGPRFRREFNSTLRIDETQDSEEDITKVDNRCFNCQENHSLAECPHPRNQQEINKNRAAFHKSQPKLTNRYHEEKADRFGRFKPGVISDTLRRALGLRSDDIPMHIYRMRLLGYPPGWVEEIKEHSSGLEFIDTPNSPERDDTVEKLSFDLSRVIEYPGFNVPLSSRYRDEWRYLQLPPMQPYHMKENFIEQLKRHAHEHNNAPRPKRIRFDSGETNKPPNLEIIDMDTDGENGEDGESDASIEDLEQKRLALLAQLQEEGSNSGSHNGETGITGNDDEDANGETDKDKPNQPVADVASPKTSRLLEVGTPVAIQHSSFSSLPNREKFAQGMGDLELYENLPNSTGTFQKMRSLLEKIRRVFKKS